MEKLKSSLNELNEKFNLVGWSWCGITLSMCVLAVKLPLLEYNHRYYHGASISYSHNYEGILLAIVFLHMCYMFFRFWLIGKYSKPAVGNPTWDMVFLGLVLLIFQIKVLLAMNIRLG